MANHLGGILISPCCAGILFRSRRKPQSTNPSAVFLHRSCDGGGIFPALHRLEKEDQPTLVARRSEFVSMGEFSFERRSISI